MIEDLYCPYCTTALTHEREAFSCAQCLRKYPVIDGIPSFVEDDSFKDNHFTSAYFKDLIAIEKKHFWHKTKRLLLYSFLKKNIPDYKSKGFFELGCGCGYFLHFLREKGVYVQGGGDLFPESLQIVSEYLDVPLYRVNALELPFQDRFGIVALLDIIEHIEDDVKVLKEVHRSLKSGGYVLVTVPALEMLRRNLDNVLRHKRRYTKNQLKQCLEKSGFTPLKITYYNAYTVPFLLVQRLIENMKKDNLSTDAHEVIHFNNTINPVANFVFQALFAIERKIIVNFGLPVGGSLVALGQKK